MNTKILTWEQRKLNANYYGTEKQQRNNFSQRKKGNSAGARLFGYSNSRGKKNTELLAGSTKVKLAAITCASYLLK